MERMKVKYKEISSEVYELKEDNEGKLSAAEGQKLWANFRKYATNDEFRSLYKKTMPAISSFEDKLKENNDQNQRIQEMIRRVDETICIKADRTALKEYKDYCEISFMTKSDN